MLCDHPDFADLLEELEQLYTRTVTGDTDLHSLITSTCLEKIAHRSSAKIDDLSSRSLASKLWLNYQQMVRIVRKLIEADCIGSWMPHLHAVAECLPIFAAAGHGSYLKSAYLYLQSMTTVEHDNPSVFHRFMNGLHAVRRTDQHWAGLGCDLLIEQTLMRSLKTAGGLTRGSGMSEHQRALWTQSVPVSSSYSDAMQVFTNRSFATSEQHKETATSRMKRYREDLEKIANRLKTFSPYSNEVALQNIITGVDANEDVNVHNLFTIGSEIVVAMEGRSMFSFSYRRSMKAKTLSSTVAIDVVEEKSIDPALLFQRLLVASQAADISLDEVMVFTIPTIPL